MGEIVPEAVIFELNLTSDEDPTGISSIKAESDNWNNDNPLELLKK